jgi:hypothetical protein
MRVVRTRGALSGFLLLLLGIWGALIPFIGPYFRYAYTPDAAWAWTAGRLWLEVLPGAAAAVAGLMLMGTAHRSVGVFAGWLASVAGAWFVIGPVLGRLWDGTEGAAGLPVGGTARQVWEQIGFFSGLGAAILFLGALALGRFTVTSVRDLRAAERARTPDAATTAPVPATTFRDNRVEDTRAIGEPVGARAGTTAPATAVGTGTARTGTTRSDTVRTDTARTDTARTDTARTDTAAARGGGARGRGLLGRLRSGTHGDRAAEDGATRDDALGTRRD